MIKTMSTKLKSKSVPGNNLPEVKLAVAEKVFRDIARRCGEYIRKRRSATLKEQFGDGYMVTDLHTNVVLNGVTSHDGCDLGLVDLAKWYEDVEENTRWQKTVIKSVLAGRVNYD
jgi:hypothetical protein